MFVPQLHGFTDNRYKVVFGNRLGKDESYSNDNLKAKNCKIDKVCKLYAMQAQDSKETMKIET